MEAMPLGLRTAEPSIREDQRNLPAVNGANPPSASANLVVPIVAIKLMIVDDGSVESAFSLS